MRVTLKTKRPAYRFALKDYDPLQPRWPRGTPGGLGGQWMGLDTPPIDFGSDEERMKWADDSAAGWRGSLTDAERESIHNYARAYYNPVNKGHRHDAPMMDKVRKVSDDVTGALDRASMPDNVIVYRGMNTPELEEIAARESVEGVILKDHGFTSTTLDFDFGSYVGDAKGYLAEVLIPKGSKAAYIGGISQYGLMEKEVLIQRGSSYRIVGFDPTHSPPIFQMELVQDGSEPVYKSRFTFASKDYDPLQPRWPAGSPNSMGGQWIDTGASLLFSVGPVDVFDSPSGVDSKLVGFAMDREGNQMYYDAVLMFQPGSDVDRSHLTGRYSEILTDPKSSMPGFFQPVEGYYNPATGGVDIATRQNYRRLNNDPSMQDALADAFPEHTSINFGTVAHPPVRNLTNPDAKILDRPEVGSIATGGGIRTAKVYDRPPHRNKDLVGAVTSDGTAYYAEAFDEYDVHGYPEGMTTRQLELWVARKTDKSLDELHTFNYDRRALAADDSGRKTVFMDDHAFRTPTHVWDALERDFPDASYQDAGGHYVTRESAQGPVSGRGIHALSEELQGEWARDVGNDRDRARAADQYASNYYRTINGALRQIGKDGNRIEDMDDREVRRYTDDQHFEKGNPPVNDLKSLTRTLDEIIEDAGSLEYPIEVRRAMEWGELSEKFDDGRIVGDVYTDWGYTSTTTSDTTIDHFRRRSGIISYIEVPGAMEIAHLSKVVGHDEEEFLLPRGLEYVTIDAWTDEEGNRFIRQQVRRRRT